MSEIKKIKKRIKNWSLPTKIGLLLGFIGFLATSLFGIASIFQNIINNNIDYRIEIFSGVRHLGDNEFARIGGISLPKYDNPLNQEFNDIIFYDKEEEIFFTTWGQTNFVQKIANHYLPIFNKVNLEAWKHIFSDNIYIKNKYEGYQIQIGSDTILRWEENRGQFYFRYAVIGRATSINLYKELLFLGFNKKRFKLKKAKLFLHGLHGSKRIDQPDCVELILNNVIYPIKFNSLLLRNEEVIEFELDPKDLIIALDKSNDFAIIVLPFIEKYPIPPQNSKYNSIGPAHFRDIEIGGISIELDF